MMIRSKIQPAAIFVIIVTLGMFLAIPLGLFSEPAGPRRVFAHFSIVVFLLLIVILSRFIKFIALDTINKRLVFSRPLWFQKWEYGFDEILGFVYTIEGLRYQYKGLLFKTRDSKKFSISEFECSNLKDIETVCLQHFDLRRTGSFDELTRDQKWDEVKSIRLFELSRKRDVRESYGIGALFCIALAGIFLDAVINHQSPRLNAVFFVIMMSITVFLVRKAFRIHKKIKQTGDQDSTIKPATAEDVPELNKLVNSAYRGETSKQGWASEADLLDGTRIDENALHEILQQGDTTILLYKEAAELLGCVELRKEGDGLYLGMLSVRPDLQAKGIGKKLMFAGEDFARTQGCKKVFMTVISVRDKLIEWYVRHGYRLTGERKPFNMPDERWGTPKQKLEFVVLEKLL